MRSIDKIYERIRKSRWNIQTSKVYNWNDHERSVCSSIGGLQHIYHDFFDPYKKILASSSRETEVGRRENEGIQKDVIRVVTTITDKDSIDLVKKFLEIGTKERHVKNLENNFVLLAFHEENHTILSKSVLDVIW